MSLQCCLPTLPEGNRVRAGLRDGGVREGAERELYALVGRPGRRYRDMRVRPGGAGTQGYLVD